MKSDNPHAGHERLLTLIDLDELFSSNPNATIINDDTLIDQQNNKNYKNEVYNSCDGELGFVPTCKCGNLRGVSKKGAVCPMCGTECNSFFVDHLSHAAWIGIPDTLPPVLHPVWYMLLKQWTMTSKRSSSIVDILMNPSLEAPDDLVPFLPPERSFRYFHDHFDELFNMMLKTYPKTAKKKMAHTMEIFARHYRHLAFTRHLPILHNSLHPLYKTGDTISYGDAAGGEILSAVIDLSTLGYALHSSRMSQFKIDTKLYGVYVNCIEYYRELIKKKLGGKEAMLRKHDFGTRIHWSVRTVVTPHDKSLPLDEVILPWGTILNCLKLQVLNFLMNRYFKTMEEAITIFMTALSKYDPLVDKILTQILYEFPDHKMPLEIGRNPTIAYGSIMKLYVKEFRKDPEDETLSINACIVKPANIDFDGDELYAFPVFESDLAKSLSSSHPSQFLFNTRGLGLSSSIGLLQQNYASIEAFLEDDPEDSSHYEEVS